MCNISRNYSCAGEMYPDNVYIARITCTITLYECVCNIHFSVDASSDDEDQWEPSRLVQWGCFQPDWLGISRRGHFRRSSHWTVINIVFPSCSLVFRMSWRKNCRPGKAAFLLFSHAISKKILFYFIENLLRFQSPYARFSLSLSLPFAFLSLGLNPLDAGHRQRNGRNLWYTITKERKLITGVWSNMI